MILIVQFQLQQQRLSCWQVSGRILQADGTYILLRSKNYNFGIEHVSDNDRSHF